MEDLNELENIFTIFYMNSRAFASALEENNFKNEDAKLLAWNISNDRKEFMRNTEEKIKMIKQINK